MIGSFDCVHPLWLPEVSQVTTILKKWISFDIRLSISCRMPQSNQPATDTVLRLRESKSPTQASQPTVDSLLRNHKLQWRLRQRNLSSTERHREAAEEETTAHDILAPWKDAAGNGVQTAAIFDGGRWRDVGGETWDYCPKREGEWNKDLTENVSIEISREKESANEPRFCQAEIDLSICFLDISFSIHSLK